MAGVRVIGSTKVSHTPGTKVGLQVNTFAAQKFKAMLTGENLARLALEAIQPAYETALEEWPVLTGASRDSIDTEIIEIGAHHARVALTVGGEKLIQDIRNKSGKDYAPFIEFNGTSTTPAGTLTNAMVMNEGDAKAHIHEGVAELLAGAR